MRSDKESLRPERDLLKVNSRGSGVSAGARAWKKKRKHPVLTWYLPFRSPVKPGLSQSQLSHKHERDPFFLRSVVKSWYGHTIQRRQHSYKNRNKVTRRNSGTSAESGLLRTSGFRVAALSHAVWINSRLLHCSQAPVACIHKLACSVSDSSP